MKNQEWSQQAERLHSRKCERKPQQCMKVVDNYTTKSFSSYDHVSVNDGKMSEVRVHKQIMTVNFLKVQQDFEDVSDDIDRNLFRASN